jgi:Tfp pilus assembly protein PilO
MRIKREIILSVFFSIIIIGTGINVYFNVLTDLFELNRLNDRFQKISGILKKARYRKELNRRIVTMKEAMKSFYATVPQRNKYPEIVEALHQTGRRNGVFVKVTNLAPFRDLKDSPGFELLGLKMPVKGSYRAVRSFISDVEQMQTMVALDHVKMVESRENEDKDSAVDLELGFTLFFRKEGI